MDPFGFTLTFSPSIIYFDNGRRDSSIYEKQRRYPGWPEHACHRQSDASGFLIAFDRR
jgi:hypothetical protein